MTDETDRQDSGVERWIDQRRDELKGNPTEFARGYESCLDDVEQQLSDDGEPEGGTEKSRHPCEHTVHHCRKMQSTVEEAEKAAYRGDLADASVQLHHLKGRLESVLEVLDDRDTESTDL